MSNRLYRSDYSGYYFAKSDLNNRGKRDWAYYRFPHEICELTEKEKDLEEYMEQKRDLMISCSIRCPYQKPDFPPVKRFWQQKDFILQNDLFQNIFCKMPKGGLLHVHGYAAVSAERLIRLMLDWNKKAQDKKRRIRIMDKEIPGLEYRYSKGTLLYEWQCEKLKGYAIPLEKYLQKQKNWEKIMQMLTLKGGKEKSSTGMWERINIIFSRTTELFADRDFYVRYYETFFEECIADHIRYVEIRCGFEKFTDPDGGAWRGRGRDYCVKKAMYFKETMAQINPAQPDREFIDAILEALRLIRQRCGDEQINAKIILCAGRYLNPYVKSDLELLCKEADAAIALKEHYCNCGKEVVIGFDFTGTEDGVCGIDHYAKKMIYRPVGYGYRSNKEGQSDQRLRIERIDFFLHAGESNWYFNNNPVAAAIVSKYRIGDAFHMRRSMEVIKGVAEGPTEMLTEPVAEICPIWDQSLGSCIDLRSHPAYEYMKNGIPCVLGNDSPQLLENPGLSFDFWEAYVGMGLTLPLLKMMIFITYLYEFTIYAAGELDLERAKCEFRHDWNCFMEEIGKKL